MGIERSSGGFVRTGWVVSGLVIAFLVFDGVTKVMQVQPVIDACARLGIGATTAAAIGALLLAITTLYALPQSRAVGVVLLTGYLGGAVATHVRAGSNLFETLFPVGFGALAWLGIALRDPELVRTILLRR